MSIAEHAEGYIISYAMALVPVKPKTKQPFRVKWNKVENLITTPEDAKTFWQQRQGFNIGVQLEASNLCSLDIDDLEASKLVLEDLGIDIIQWSGQYPTIQSRPGRFRIMFKMPADEHLPLHKLAWPKKNNPLETFCVFELRAGAVQDVLPPSIHPDTQKPYVWLTPPTGTFPELPRALLAAWKDWNAIKSKAEKLCPWKIESNSFEVQATHSYKGHTNIIGDFNKQNNIEHMLLNYGYTQHGEKFLKVNSSGDDPGITIDKEKNQLFCHHASDPLATGHRIDCFEMFAIIEHGGDRKSAVKAVAESQDKLSPHTQSDEERSWPEPEPLTEKLAPETCPIDALPQRLQAAVREVQSYTQAPVGLVVSSALAAVSVAAQGLFDVARDNNLNGPISLYLLTVAQSGERKSTCDKYFTRAIEEYEKEAIEKAKPQVADYLAAHDGWKASTQGLKDRIRQLSKGKDGKVNHIAVDNAKEELRQINAQEPNPPKVPRLIFSNFTIEKLQNELRKWPSIAVISAEAGIVFGGHSMRSESIATNLGTLNTLWDGAPLRVDRQTSDSYSISAARGTMSLMVQQEILTEFNRKSNGQARGSGFFARFLFSWPESTAGSRNYKEPSINWPALDAFNQRIKLLLEANLSLDENESLEPAMLTLSPEGKDTWICYHDIIEAELGVGGQFSAVSDTASKTADNAVRLAALFHVFEGNTGDICADLVERGFTLAMWYLTEGRRFFGELALSAEVINAQRLDHWLIEKCKSSHVNKIYRRDIQRHSPGTACRNGETLKQTLDYLERMGRIKELNEGNAKYILVNPLLLSSEVE